LARSSFTPQEAGKAADPNYVYRRQVERLARRARLIHDLRPGEQLVALHRQHPAVLFGSLVPPLVIFVMWAVASVFVLPFISSLGPDPYGPPAEGLRVLLPGLVWLGWMVVPALLVLWAAYKTLDWSDDWLALTNRRLILMDKHLFLRESRREVPIDRVQNVTAEYPNSLGVGLDYGDLRVDTAGLGVLEFRHLPHPRVMREAIFTQQAQLKASQPSAEDVRRAAVRSILRGTDPALHEQSTPPGGNPVTPAPTVQGGVGSYGLLTTLFPFAPLRAGDSVTWHKHWAVLARGVLPPAILWWAAFVVWLAAIGASGSGQYSSLAQVIGWVVVVMAPVCLLWALWKWDDWRNDIYRLDRERVYDIERLPLGMREQSKETLITRVTDVMYTVPGPLANILDYGDIELKTPGEATQFIFRSVPRPREIQREIMDRIEEYRLRAQAGAGKEIEAWLKAYEDVRREGEP
jgi:hypothetical protein